jgi:hypothetical protein
MVFFIFGCTGNVYQDGDAEIGQQSTREMNPSSKVVYAELSDVWGRSW